MSNTFYKTKQEIKNEKLTLFEQSIGKMFSLKAKAPENKNITSLIDEVVGVDRGFEHVIGKKYGNFHIDLVSLCEEC